MATITGGKVSYGRTIKTGDFESKRVDVELAFSVGDGEDYGHAFDLVSRQVARRCEEMAKGKEFSPAEPIHELAAASVALPAPAAHVAPEAAAKAVEDVPAAKKGPGRPKGTTVKKPKDEPEIADEKKAKEYAATTLKAIDKAEGKVEPNEEVTITDKALMEVVTRKAKDVGPDRVKELRNKYTGSVTMQIVALPQAKRRAFLDELETLE